MRAQKREDHEGLNIEAVRDSGHRVCSLNYAERMSFLVALCGTSFLLGIMACLGFARWRHFRQSTAIDPELSVASAVLRSRSSVPDFVGTTFGVRPLHGEGSPSHQARLSITTGPPTEAVSKDQPNERPAKQDDTSSDQDDRTFGQDDTSGEQGGQGSDTREESERNEEEANLTRNGNLSFIETEAVSGEELEEIPPTQRSGARVLSAAATQGLFSSAAARRMEERSLLAELEASFEAEYIRLIDTALHVETAAYSPQPAPRVPEDDEGSTGGGTTHESLSVGEGTGLESSPTLGGTPLPESSRSGGRAAGPVRSRIRGH